MQLDYPDILRSFQRDLLSPGLVLNSQLPRLMLAGGDVARGDGGVWRGVGFCSPTPNTPPPHPIPEKSALGRSIGGAKAGKRMLQTASPGMGYFFKSLINEYFLEINLWYQHK